MTRDAPQLTNKTWAFVQADKALVNEIGGRQRMQARQCLQGSPLPHPHHRGAPALHRLTDPQRSSKHRIRRDSGGVDLHTTAVERRG